MFALPLRQMPSPCAIPRPFWSFLFALSFACSMSFFPRCCAFSLFSGSNSSAADPHHTDPLMCYRGIKYFVGQEEIDDNVRCELNMVERRMFGLEKYCYKFISHTGLTDFVKRGCSVVICSGLRNVCAKLEFEGVQGELCCCSDSSYCNASKRTKPRRPFGTFLMAFFSLFASAILKFFHIESKMN